MKHDDQHCTLIAWSKQRFLCRSTVEHVYGILLDEKFLYRSVHAVFREHEVVRGVVGAHPPVGPDHLRHVGPGVLSWAPGQPCNSHHSRHTGQDTVVVPYLRFGSFLHHKSVGGRGCGQQPDAFRPQPELPRRRGESSLGVRVHHSFWLCITPSLCVFLESIAIACVSWRVSPMHVFPCSFSPGTARARSLYTHERSRTTESTIFEHIHHKDRRRLQLFQRLALRQGRASFCDICQHTSSRPPIAGLLSHHGTKTTWAMAFPRINCRTTIAIVVTATATVTLSLRACLFLCYTPITSPSAADSFYFLELPGMGQPCVICQDKAHLEEFRLRAGIGARCVRAEGSRSLA